MAFKFNRRKFRARLGSLKRRHANLERRISAEKSRPKPDDFSLQQLKRLKLHIRDQIAQLRGRPVGGSMTGNSPA